MAKFPELYSTEIKLRFGAEYEMKTYKDGSSHLRWIKWTTKSEPAPTSFIPWIPLPQAAKIGPALLRELIFINNFK